MRRRSSKEDYVKADDGATGNYRERRWTAHTCDCLSPVPRKPFSCIVWYDKPAGYLVNAVAVE